MTLEDLKPLQVKEIISFSVSSTSLKPVGSKIFDIPLTNCASNSDLNLKKRTML